MNKQKGFTQISSVIVSILIMVVAIVVAIGIGYFNNVTEENPIEKEEVVEVREEVKGEADITKYDSPIEQKIYSIIKNSSGYIYEEEKGEVYWHVKSNKYEFVVEDNNGIVKDYVKQQDDSLIPALGFNFNKIHTIITDNKSEDYLVFVDATFSEPVSPYKYDPALKNTLTKHKVLYLEIIDGELEMIDIITVDGRYGGDGVFWVEEVDTTSGIKDYKALHNFSIGYQYATDSYNLYFNRENEITNSFGGGLSDKVPQDTDAQVIYVDNIISFINPYNRDKDGWLSYSSGELGINIKYPNTVGVIEEENSVLVCLQEEIETNKCSEDSFLLQFYSRDDVITGTARNVSEGYARYNRDNNIIESAVFNPDGLSGVPVDDWSPSRCSYFIANDNLTYTQHIIFTTDGVNIGYSSVPHKYAGEMGGGPIYPAWINDLKNEILESVELVGKDSVTPDNCTESPYGVLIF